MKKVIALILAFICIELLFISYDKPEITGDSPNIPFDKNGAYSGFFDLPMNYTIEDAKNDGCFVIQNLKVIANNNVWVNFVETSLLKENVNIRIAKFYSEDTKSPYFLDLFYENGHYYLFDSSAENREKKPYLYLLPLEGQFGSPKRDSGITVLTDDDSLTFDTVMREMLSSNMEYKKSVSPYKIVIFN